MKKKIVYFILFFSMFLTFKTLSYDASHIEIFDLNKSTSYIKASSDVIFNQLMTLKDVKVAFSQDDDKYTFIISANSSVKIYGNLFNEKAHSYDGALVPLLYKEENFGSGMKISESLLLPHADCYNLDCYVTSEVKIKNKTQSKYVNKYYLTYTEHIPTESVNTNNGERYFIPKSLRNATSANEAFRYTDSYPIYCNNNGEGVSLDRNSSFHYYTYTGEGGSCFDTYYARMDITISINKKYIDDYRYLCFAHECIAESYGYYTDTRTNSYSVSVCSNTIDLKDYVDCEHNWTCSAKDKLTHTVYCDKCKWNREEPHSLLYEYDGIKYDVCTCSYIDKVKYRFKINDDVIGEAEEVCDTECSYLKHEYTKKTGYKFKWYDKYVLELIDGSNLSTLSNATHYIFIATTSEIDDIAENHSVLYEAKYSPIKYTFKYSNLNNCDLKLNDEISNQEVYYDEIANLKSSIDVVGYEFKGWTLDKGSKNIDLLDKEDVTNYTTEDLKEYTLYPVYERMDYTLVYNAGGYQFADGKKEKIIRHNYFDDGELETPCINSDSVVYDGYVDEYGNKYKKLSDVKNVIEKLKRSGMTLHLQIHVQSVGIGRSEHTGKGNGNITPTSSGTNVLDLETSGVVAMIETESPFDQSIPYNYLYEIRQNYNKIKGMSNTNEEIVDEEIENVDDKPRVATISLINKFKFDDGNVKKSKWELLRDFINNNKVLCIIAGGLMLAVLFLYEALIIRHFTKKETL